MTVTYRALREAEVHRDQIALRLRDHPCGELLGSLMKAVLTCCEMRSKLKRRKGARS